MPNQLGGPSPFPGFSNFQYPWETGDQFNARLQAEYAALGGRALPPEWDALAPGGAGLQGSGQYSTPSPLMFPGERIVDVRTPDGKILNGEVGPGGVFQGTVTLPDGTTERGNFSIDLQSNTVGGPVGFPATATGANVELVGGAGGPSYALPGESPQDTLERQRQQAFGLLEQARGIYGQPFAQQIQSNLAGGMAGANVPFTPEVQSNLFADVADAAAGQVGSEQEMIRRQFARQGLSGGGGQLSAEVGARRAGAAQETAGRRQIQTTAALENFMAQERARQEAAAFQQQAYQGFLQPALADAAMRERFQVTGESDTSALANALAGLGATSYAQSFAPGAPQGYSGRATGGTQQGPVGIQMPPPQQQSPPATATATPGGASSAASKPIMGPAGVAGQQSAQASYGVPLSSQPYPVQGQQPAPYPQPAPASPFGGASYGMPAPLGGAGGPSPYFMGPGASPAGGLADPQQQQTAGNVASQRTPGMWSTAWDYFTS